MPCRRGLLLAGGTGSRLHPLTMSTNKHLLAVLDQPMIHYPLAALMRLGIREIALLTTPRDARIFADQLGDGSQWGLELEILVQDKPRGIADAYRVAARYLRGGPSCLVLGDNLLYGHGWDACASQLHRFEYGAGIFGYPVADARDFGIAYLNESGEIMALVEKPESAEGALAIPGFYFCDGTAPDRVAELHPSARGELEIIDLLNSYLTQKQLRLCPLPPSDIWIDMGTVARIQSAARSIAAVQRQSGKRMACLEEIALEQNWISISALAKHASWTVESEYGEYVRKLADRH